MPGLRSQTPSQNKDMNKMLIVRKEVNQGRLILIIVDKEIIGKKFEEGQKQLDLKSDFYQGEEMEEKEADELIPQAYLLHLVGKRAVRLALEKGLTEKKKVLQIKNVPHLEIIQE